VIPAEAIAAAPGVELELVPCAICGSDAAPEVFWGRDRLCGLPGEFRVVQCTTCSLVYLNPRPNRGALRDFYPSQYPSHQPVVSRGSRPQSWARRRAKAWAVRWYTSGLDFDPGQVRETLGGIEDFPPHFIYGFFPTKPGGRLLDVGCGSGLYLHAFQRLGWEACGVEISAPVAEQARQTLGLRIFTGVLEEARFPDGHFDVVTLLHVLEHLPDPVGTLREVSRILKPEGIVVLAVPNFRSAGALIFRSYWFPLDVPRHLYHFSAHTLWNLLTKVDGIRPVRVNYFPGIFIRESWEYLCRDHPLLGTALPPRVIARLAAPLGWAAALARLSDFVVVYARKMA
jgi:2-polyprenyl-3-methyl-5-hydroxy-6-metoxy-1,4-benzoquinol methylase